MSESMRARLVNAQQANAWLNNAYAKLKPYLLSGHSYDISIKPESRTSGQNERFHAICGDIAGSGIQWAGKPRTAAQWKVLLVSGHAAATKESFDMVPGLEGEFINLRESTALMSIKRGSSLIEYATAFAVENGVLLRDIETEFE